MLPPGALHTYSVAPAMDCVVNVAVLPGQALTGAVGFLAVCDGGALLTLIVTEPDEVPLQFTSFTLVSVYVVVEDGLTWNVSGLLLVVNGPNVLLPSE